MARPRLNLTPEEQQERRERRRAQAASRKKAQRAHEKELKMAQMARNVSSEMAELAELHELAGELLQMRLPAAIEVVAEWQSVNQKPFPALFMEPRSTHEPWPNYYDRLERARKLGLIRLMAADHASKVGNRRRKARFDEKEVKEATALGMTVDAYRKRKKGERLAAKMAKIIADRAAA